MEKCPDCDEKVIVAKTTLLDGGKMMLALHPELVYVARVEQKHPEGLPRHMVTAKVVTAYLPHNCAAKPKVVKRRLVRSETL